MTSRTPSGYCVRSPAWARRPAPHGFTLIELMITVAVVGILAAIAYPSFTEAILKGRRAEARTALTDLLQQQERYLTQNGSYRTFSSSDTNVPFRRQSGDGGTNAYTLDAVACDNLPTTDCIRVRATPPPGRPDPRVGMLWLQSNGQRGCTGTDTRVCWP